jgi:N-acetylglucosamine-6-sulfatase
MVTKSSKGSTCVGPWSVIHLAEDVKSLGDALSTTFGGFYASVAEKVKFDKCELGYILESEGTQESLAFQAGNEEL